MQVTPIINSYGEREYVLSKADFAELCSHIERFPEGLWYRDYDGNPDSDSLQKYVRRATICDADTLVVGFYYDPKEGHDYSAVTLIAMPADASKIVDALNDMNEWIQPATMVAVQEDIYEIIEPYIK